MKKAKQDDSDKWRTQHGLSGERHRAYSSLLRAHAATTAQIQELSQIQGALPLDWYDILLALDYAPEGRLRVGNLACHVTLSRSGLTRLVDKLEAAGLVERHLNPHDRRSFEVILTAKGRAERERAWPIYARAIAEVFGNHYTDDEAAILADLLTRQFEACGGSCEEDAQTVPETE
ncbi:MAG TPA: MarR family winged helix-turn-helix transcriptional regulator [Abditibacteriaceae bacterium]|jgi:DNA-binding MarR family transcriptional regulator